MINLVPTLLAIIMNFWTPKGLQHIPTSYRIGKCTNYINNYISLYKRNLLLFWHQLCYYNMLNLHKEANTIEIIRYN